ncbi:Asp-tRNA(Asn)/Glu-tRNA(Gln) amidotransferase subunit GatC [Serinibacter arcticus]|uniref:Aspartyl/glutamyl-tRNA(Asn/Gln) amidotransferase subunit C n=1 Tax=Serinibacter arcticus TaxID=1655435 RepID=A0A4Z1DYH8_9MICO|nr:Asp-tRNA(Asn)/Glu-tRNA(Gln) amidotransferase subunit GatC [Serinibacter arcticus]TGO03969.1 Aspartyl-tRNA(Asn) amidotransferase subunit C [Serinibacter arcticus]
MPTFNSEEVARLAALARIDLTPDELTQFAGELEVIAHAVEKVSELATADVPATSHPIPLTNVYREDVVSDVVDRDAVLAAAPASQDGKFLVPQILGEEA